MKSIAPDDIDFAAFEWQSDCKAKVRRAVEFADQIEQALTPVRDDKTPTVYSFKLGRYLRFRPREVTAWAGYSGHRKSMMTGQVALELARQRVSTLVVSLEMPPAMTLARMARQFTAKAVPNGEDLARFYRSLDALYVFDHQGRISPAQCMALLRYFAEVHGGQQVFVDSFMMVCDSEESMDAQKQMTTDLVRLAQDTGLHVHLIAHCRKPSSGDEGTAPGKHDLRGTAAITDQCANVLTVWANKPKVMKLQTNPHDSVALAEPDAALTVCKQRNGEFEGRLKLWVDPQSMRFVDTQDEEVQAW